MATTPIDERGGCLKWGLENTATWLAWRCDLSMATAREKVRVAQALKHLPSISEAFSSGELSYSKVRSLTRVANGDNEQALVAFALRNTASHVAGYCHELRMGAPASRYRTAVITHVTWSTTTSASTMTIRHVADC